MNRPSPHHQNLSIVPLSKGTLPLCTPPYIDKSWLWPYDHISNQYSSGSPRTAVVELRDKSIGFLYSVCVRLDVPPSTYSVGATVFHRFYMTQSLTDKYRHPYEIAATCVLIASKIDENVKKLSSLVKAVTEVAQKGQVSSNYEAELQKWKSAILKHEQWVLAFTGFDLQIDDPFQSLYTYLYTTSLPELLGFTAQSLLVESYRTTVCLQYPPAVLACASIFLAFAFSDIQQAKDEWWTVLGVNEVHMLECADQFLDGHFLRDPHLAKEYLAQFSHATPTSLPTLKEYSLLSLSHSSNPSSANPSHPNSPHPVGSSTCSSMSSRTRTETPLAMSTSTSSYSLASYQQPPLDHSFHSHHSNLPCPSEENLEEGEMLD